MGASEWLIYLVFQHFGTQYLLPCAVVKYYSTHSNSRTTEGHCSGGRIGGKTWLCLHIFWLALNAVAETQSQPQCPGSTCHPTKLRLNSPTYSRSRPEAYPGLYGCTALWFWGQLDWLFMYMHFSISTFKTPHFPLWFLFFFLQVVNAFVFPISIATMTRLR